MTKNDLAKCREVAQFWREFTARNRIYAGAATANVIEDLCAEVERLTASAAQVQVLQDERQFMIDYVHAYAAYFNSTWWQLFDSPDASPLSFEAWITQEAEDWL